MPPDDEESTAQPLTPQELDHLLALDPPSRAEWMLEDCARHEEAWALADAQGWVVFKLDPPPAEKGPWALPLWPRQELAALAVRNAGEQPRRLDLEEVLEALLPEVDRRGWQVLACPGTDGGLSEPAENFRSRLAEAWSELNEEES